MKRSEIIWDIASNILLSHPKGTPDWKEAQEMAEVVLKGLEDVGMLPPYNNKGLRVNNEAINYCKWEDEDDN